jgi:hypothetical protein
LAAEIDEPFEKVSIAALLHSKEKYWTFIPNLRCTQEFKPHQVDARVPFCRWLLENPDWLSFIHLSDESRFFLGDDQRWV